MNIYEEYKKQLRAELAAIKPEEDEMDRRLTSKEKMEIISRTDEPTQDLAE